MWLRFKRSRWRCHGIPESDNTIAVILALDDIHPGPRAAGPCPRIPSPGTGRAPESVINTVDTPDTILKRSVQPSDGPGHPTGSCRVIASRHRRRRHRRRRPTNPAAGNIDVLLAQVRPPISGGRVRMVMCSLNVKPRSHRFRCPTTEYGKCAIQDGRAPSHTNAGQPPHHPCMLDEVLHRGTRE